MTERNEYIPDQETNIESGRKVTIPDMILTSSLFAGVFGGIAYAFGGRQVGIEVGGGLGGFFAGIGMAGFSTEKAKSLAIEGKTIKALLMATKGSIENAIGIGAAGAATGFSAADVKGALAGGISGAVLGRLVTFEDFLETRRIIKAGGRQ